MSKQFMKFIPFKDAVIFALKEMPECFSDTQLLQSNLSEFAMGDLGPRTERVSGFINPTFREDDESLFHQVDDFIFIAWRSRTRQVDTVTLNENVARRVEELEAKGTEVTVELKEDITQTCRQELLPYMKIQVKTYRAMVMISHSLLIVDAGSEKSAEDFNLVLRKAIGSLKTQHMTMAFKPFEQMADWVRVKKGDEPAEVISKWPSWITLDGGKMLQAQGLDDSSIKARLQSFGIYDEATQKVMEDMGVTQCPVSLWDTRFENERDYVNVMDCTLVSVPDLESVRKLDIRLKGMHFWGLGAHTSEDLVEINGLMFLMGKTLEYVLMRLFGEFGGAWDLTVSPHVRLDQKEIDEKTLMGWRIEIRGEESAMELTNRIQSDEQEADELIEPAKAFLAETRRGSVSALQRQFKIGYNRAARIMEALENMNVVTAPGHNGQREVLLAPEVC